MSKNDPAERGVGDIRGKTRKQYSAREDPDRGVGPSRRGEKSISGLCRQQRIGEGLYVNVPSGRGIGDIGIIIPIGLRSHKGAGNAFCHALSSSAWRFLTRILAPT